MSCENFSLEKDTQRGIATLTLTHPQDGNRLTDADIGELAETVRATGEDRAIKLIVLRAQGDRYCMGRNPAGPKPATPPDAFAHRHRVSTTIMNVYASVRNAPVPVISVVQGEASGFGCALAAVCDMTIASTNAQFSLPELDHNFPPTLAMSALLHKVPSKIVAHMVYTRSRLSAAQAHGFGLVSEVVEPGDLDAAVERTVAKLADRSRLALGTIKEYLSTALHVDQVAAGKLAENMISVALVSNA